MLRFLSAALAAVALFISAGTARAQSDFEPLREGGVTVVTVEREVASIVVSNEEIVSVEVRGRRSVVVFAKKQGTVELIVLDAANRVLARRAYEVRADTTLLSSLIKQAAPTAEIDVARAGEVVVLRGQATDSAEAAMIVSLVQGAAPQARIINLMSSEVDDQVAVSVKVMEVRKNRLREVGLRWSAQNRFNDGTASIGSSMATAVAQTVSGGLFGTARFTVDRLTLDAYIDFLRSEGAATLLAEPVILATDGQKAKFLAGGELPVPVPYLNTQGGTSTLGYTYKPYGVTLEFTAQILDGGRVRLQLAPEVSAVDRSQAVEFAGARVPALSTRKAETTVVLAFGESVAIAGLRSTESTNARRRLPFDTPFNIGDILAGSRSEQGTDTELVLIVTPVRGREADQRFAALTPPASASAAQPAAVPAQ